MFVTTDYLIPHFQPSFQTFDGTELYPTLFQKVSKLCCSIISNHPFIDGNKRIGIHIMLMFLELNGIELKYKQTELVESGLGIASDKIKYETLAECIISKSLQMKA